MFWITNAYALGAGPQAGQEGNLLTGLMPFILIFVVFYFLLIRPQQKKAKEHSQMLQSLQKGDAVITAGGLYGRILETRDDVIVVDLGDTKVTVGRSYIAGMPGKAQATAAPKREKKGKESKTRETPDETKAVAPVEENKVETPEVVEENKTEISNVAESAPADAPVPEAGEKTDDKRHP